MLKQFASLLCSLFVPKRAVSGGGQFNCLWCRSWSLRMSRNFRDNKNNSRRYGIRS